MANGAKQTTTTTSGARAPGLYASVGYQVPWLERLSTRLLAFLAVAVLVAVAALFAAETRVEAQLREQVAAELELVSRTTLGALHRAMLHDRRADAYQIMRDVARQPGMEALRLMDAEGRVTFSTEPAEIGTVMDRTAPACAGCHTGRTPPRQADLAARSRVFEGRSGRVLATVTAIQNDASCATADCHAHPASQTVLGVLDVGISLASLDATTSAFRWRSLVGSALVAALLGLAFWVFARRHVVQPVGALVAAAHRVAREDLDAEVPETFAGELGLLGATFNEMTRSLRQARGEVQALLEGLERQVEERTGALVAARDELVRTERLASVGKLAASIAHEINNPISGIMTFARLISRTLEAGVPDEATRRTLLRNLALVQRESERCSDIVRNLLDFAHERPLLEDDLSVNAVVEDALHLVASQFTIQGTRVVKRLAELPRTRGDFAQLRQACVNLLMNAAEAMPFEGTLTVETALAEDGAAVEIAVADTGPGIPAEQQGRVFDPFFSTKEKASGLGLSVVHGILTHHGGSVRLVSQPGQGTRVILRLPVSRREGGPAGG
ncbi:MAG: HAMP domain-containing protein [Anaeromyxobacter sp.]|nr:HAMP domain-containing protein [Anaeromyxobacter sp.]MBL0277166.1 HAMP domain-containing protein [Anaeromyxobacter sp.]